MRGSAVRLCVWGDILSLLYARFCRCASRTRMCESRCALPGTRRVSPESTKIFLMKCGKDLFPQFFFLFVSRSRTARPRITTSEKKRTRPVVVGLLGAQVPRAVCAEFWQICKFVPSFPSRATKRWRAAVAQGKQLFITKFAEWLVSEDTLNNRATATLRSRLEYEDAPGTLLPPQKKESK